MRTTQVFFKNLKAILKRKNLSLSWITEAAGINEILLSTIEWISLGLSFELVMKVAMALDVSIESLISENGTIKTVLYEKKFSKCTATDLYRKFWKSVINRANTEGKSIYELSRAAGTTISGIIRCAFFNKDIDIQRAEAIALLLDTTIDNLIKEQIPIKEECDFGNNILVANF